ncbi:pyrimidine 5-nucleotidase [Aureobasidium sp. EXF-12298]|nr:pyrimidine 5-nucleotidase [Aureobasidium sp. EXF-12298]KAI4757647.1 pyrimidine 5-nucleotidase [Aureobasidium sp. EXF-12344]KAI4774666.1 pyrimidine 5-nucleotidase [Aureobasidium sp. EXF-3400]
MADNRKVFFFDIDNCVGHRTQTPQVLQLLTLLTVVFQECVTITLTSHLVLTSRRQENKYFETHLSLSREDANELHTRYYKDYGLAIEGLVRHHKVDALEYNEKVDDALPLEDIMSPDPKLRKLLEDLDTSKVKPWLFTNAYINHGRRVVKLLGVEDMFEGITYCDYSAAKFLCKPSPDMFKKAMVEAGATSVEDCYFVDDSALNAAGATKLGWTAAHLVEPGVTAPVAQVSKYQISNLEELRSIFPQFFKSTQ